MLEISLKREGYGVTACRGVREALEAIQQSPKPYPVVLTDLSMPDGSGLDVLGAAKTRSSATEVILITAHSTVENALAAMHAGAYDFVTKPFDPAELNALIGKAHEKHALIAENERLKALTLDSTGIEAVARSRAMRDVLEVVDRIAPVRTTVFITGPSGTGKERIARRIHQRSDRASRPFLVVNCGALPEALMESELFGHEKGAFTGAVQRHIGMFRGADGGTLFLDEVGELPLSLQVKLLRVLQERTVRPVGASSEVPVDVRVLAATNRDVEEAVEQGRFRQDLYYRLNVIRLRLPPLSERREDIPGLVEVFVKRFAAEQGKPVIGLTPDAQRALERYPFPGNVRELENIIERGVALAVSPYIGLGELAPEVSGMAGALSDASISLPDGGCQLDEVLGDVERRLLVEALDRAGGVRKHAAELLGITFRSIRYRLKKLGMAGDGADEEPDSESS